MSKNLKRRTFLSGAIAFLVGCSFAEPAKIIRDVVYSPEAGADGVGDLYLPANFSAETRVMLAIHGGGWSGGDRFSWSGVSEFFRSDLGFAVFNIEYRLVKKGPWPLCGNDSIAAAKFLLSDAFQQRFGIACKKIWVCGGSAGAHLALWTGLSLPPEKIGGIVSISGIGVLAPDEKANPSRYVALFGRKPTPDDLVKASPLTLARAMPKVPPIFCSHATVDGAVPFEASRFFVEACQAAGAPVDFYTYEPRDKGHSIWIPGSKPHKLFPDIEAAITKFVNTRDPQVKP